MEVLLPSLYSSQTDTHHVCVNS